MTNFNNIAGLGQFGRTQQTIALADVLAASPADRNELRRLLDMIEAPGIYANCEGDRKSDLADALAKMMRGGR